MHAPCDCIVPFYNEGDRVLSVIDALTRVPSIARIICVDDGSTDGVSETLKKNFPNIILIRLAKNSGKSHAIFAGLRRVTTDSVLLFDGDLIHVDPDEIDIACQNYFSSSLDMLILRASGDIWNKLSDDMLRNYVVQSGNRMVKTSDLRKVEKLHPIGYQIEVAINQYMMDKKKNCAWQRISAVNIHKASKLPFVEGWRQNLIMGVEIIRYLGLMKELQQILFFCRRQIV